MTQPEALRLADEMERVAEYDHQVQAAAELRRLYELNQELLKELMKRDEILTAGWIFNANGLEKYWKEAYEAGRKAERKDCADLTEQMGLDGYGTLAIAAAMRKRK